VRTNLGDAKDSKNHRNYNRMAIKDGRREPKAYKANIIRIIRHLIYFKKRRSTKLGSNIINSRSDIKSRFKAVAGL
jgi:ribosomal protein L34